jgi:hypothetical protein
MLAEAVSEVGVIEGVTPAGAPEMERVIEEENPLCEAVETINVPLLPCITLTEVALELRVKLALGTTREAETLEVSVPLVAVMVSG